jgi:hypothetical protein
MLMAVLLIIDDLGQYNAQIHLQGWGEPVLNRGLA